MVWLISRSPHSCCQKGASKGLNLCALDFYGLVTLMEAQELKSLGKEFAYQKMKEDYA